MSTTINATILTELYPDWITSGIFTDLQSYSVPWADLNISNQLDLVYYGAHSGDKIISPLLEKLSSLNDDTLTTETRAQIAGMIFNVCGANWSKLYATLSLDYNPIYNVDGFIEETTQRTDSGTQTGTGAHTLSGTDTLKQTGTDAHALSGTDTLKQTGTDAHALSGTDTENHTGTDAITGNSTESGTTENDIAGFNSSDYSDSDKTTTSDSAENSQTETRNLQDSTEYGRTDTETRNLQDSTEYGKTDTETRNLQDSTEYGRTDTETRDFKNDSSGNETHTLHRYGNVGVTTSQKMITEERELWNWYFYDVVFADIDRFLTIKVY